MSGCPFCPANWPNLDIVCSTDDKFACINPLNPVTEGHVLWICADHVENAAVDAAWSENPSCGDLMFLAAQYVYNQGIQANIITSIGPDATQTVMHTHIHVVPRRPDDGLHLPWTGQKEHEAQAKEMNEKLEGR